jgi:hypothetical protein
MNCSVSKCLNTFCSFFLYWFLLLFHYGVINTGNYFNFLVFINFFYILGYDFGERLMGCWEKYVIWDSWVKYSVDICEIHLILSVTYFWSFLIDFFFVCMISLPLVNIVLWSISIFMSSSIAILNKQKCLFSKNKGQESKLGLVWGLIIVGGGRIWGKQVGERVFHVNTIVPQIYKSQCRNQGNKKCHIIMTFPCMYVLYTKLVHPLHFS